MTTHIKNVETISDIVESLQANEQCRYSLTKYEHVVFEPADDGYEADLVCQAPTRVTFYASPNIGNVEHVLKILEAALAVIGPVSAPFESDECEALGGRSAQ